LAQFHKFVLAAHVQEYLVVVVIVVAPSVLVVVAVNLQKSSLAGSQAVACSSATVAGQATVLFEPAKHT
jgi:preprotein translocase subunit SecG